MALNDETEAVFKSVRGQEVDPVSGNEVPLGSEPEEVRDDIDAKLSEGEYVVPADVVKYYGVKFFEDLRNEAKLGFAQMQSNGRIGGEPVETDMSELPFPVEELQMVDDEDPEQAVMSMGGYIRGFNQGGYNPALPEGSTPINPYSSPMGNAFEIREYINAAGEIMYIQFSGGKPLTPIPEGFTVKGSASQEVAESVQATPVDNRDNRDDNRPPTPEAVNWDEVDIDKFQETAGQYDSKLAKGLMALMGPMGLVGKLMLGHQKKNIIKAIDKRLDNPELEDRQQWLDVKNDFLNFEDLSDGDVEALPIPDGFLDDDPAKKPEEPEIVDDTPKESPKVKEPAPVTNQVIADNNRRNDERTRNNLAKEVAKAEGTTGTRTVDKKETLASKVKRGGGFSKGGLVSKPKKK
jgi:hypothetical protein